MQSQIADRAASGSARRTRRYNRQTRASGKHRWNARVLPVGQRAYRSRHLRHLVERKRTTLFTASFSIVRQCARGIAGWCGGLIEFFFDCWMYIISGIVWGPAEGAPELVLPTSHAQAQSIPENRSTQKRPATKSKIEIRIVGFSGISGINIMYMLF